MAGVKPASGDAALLLLLLLVCITLLQCGSTEGLTVGFYNKICPGAEAAITNAVKSKFNTDKSVVPGILRLYFHDCFVRGCDASLLIKSKPGNQAEKDAGANLTVHGYDVIDSAKAAVEKLCPGKVSCADIIALSTRDVVGLAGGPFYQVPCGRRDGRISRASEVNLPGPSISVAAARSAFAAKGLNEKDMVTLLGAHTLGVAHCSFFSDRLWNFQGTGLPDPTMDLGLVARLKAVCPQFGGGLGAPVALDQGTPATFDKSYYSQLLGKKGILQIDQALNIDAATKVRVKFLAGSTSPFTSDFVGSMIKLGNVGVLQGTNGEIRRICSAIN